MADIFQFWSKINPDEKIHPDDVPVFKRVGKEHGFKLACLPAPMRGSLKNARVVLLFLSPGYDKRDLADAKCIEEQNRYVRTRAGQEPYSEATPGYAWFKFRTKFLEEANVPRSKIDENASVLNIGAYHSKNFSDYPLLAALPSSRISLDWAQAVLFDEAEKRKRVVICLRAAHFWGLQRGKTRQGYLFAPEVSRSGYIKKASSKMHREIVAAVKHVLDI